MRAVVVATHLRGEGHLRSRRFDVRPVCCVDELGYWRALDGLWASGVTIVNVEHDMQVTDRHVAALLACEHPLCSWAYACHWASTGLAHDVIAAGTGMRDRATNPDPGYLTGGEEWAAWSAIGLVKITAEARVAPLRCEPWPFVELAVHDAVKRPWHMHWPSVPHHHF